MARKKISKNAKWRLATYGVIAMFLICYFLYVTISNTYYFISLRSEKNQLQENLDDLVAEQEQLEKEIVRLNNPIYLINYARENYQYSKENELIIQLFKSEEKDEQNLNDENNYWWYAGGGVSFLIIGYFIFKKNRHLSIV